MPDATSPESGTPGEASKEPKIIGIHNPDGTVTLILRKPIVAHPSVPGETCSSVTFREPNGSDLAACGMAPGAEQLSRPEFGAWVRGMTARLTAIPAGSVDQMHVMDWVDCMVIVSGFFRDTAAPAPA